MEALPGTGVLRVSVDPVDVVVDVERVLPPSPGFRGKAMTVSLEEHDRHVDPLPPGQGRSLAHPREVFPVKPRQVEPRLPIQRRPGSGPRPRKRCDVGTWLAQVQVRNLLARPHPDEIGVVPLEMCEIGGEVERVGRILTSLVRQADHGGTHAGEVDGPPLWVLEIPRIALADPERTGGVWAPMST